MQTDFEAPWRRRRLNVADFPGANNAAVAASYNAIADNPAIGVAATKVAGSRVDSVDVAAWFMAMARGDKINNTGMAIALAGAGGLINVYEVMVDGDTGLKASFGIGADLVLPMMRIRGGKVIEIGTPKRNRRGQTVGFIASDSFPLAAPFNQ